MQRVYDADPTPENAAELAKSKALLRNRQEKMRAYIADANAKCKPGTKVLKRMPSREWAGDMPKITAGRKDKARMRRGTVPVEQEDIDTLVSGELAGINFSSKPVYNIHIGTPGMTDVGYMLALP